MCLTQPTSLIFPPARDFENPSYFGKPEITLLSTSSSCLFIFIYQSDHRHMTIHKLLIGAARQPCFGCVVISPATAQLWSHNQVQNKFFIFLFIT
jgi:hypothetical protein